ncbi:ARM repeat-containing protein [Cutaneotrichosporon oleaginosum]|uniref:MMS19 nucleotide excision repair protein n=1 Tax=Cutaneotrichosporon oleaginosum TaxID=879819 RepID=A0A0J0XSJ8_9TREE|nr:ARM repeat-containing protein [Cutaneotrichosporon oleaginosum]KLT44071.1 ARM repeat-containing protein [Cutaneotrichosporon oleaginosum]TXT09473.1 hypothetical protein COLE_03407 [Cutaneotrichosporon oleaginosum]
MALDVQRIVDTQLASAEPDPSPELVQSINAGNTKLLDVVRALGTFLVSETDAVRARGLEYLSNVVASVDRAQFNRPAAATLRAFFLSKLDDGGALPHALKALGVLVKLTSFGDDEAEEVYRALVENVNMRAYPQTVRYQVYLLFDALLAGHKHAFKSMGPEFISSYCKMVDGEKDPRNLMLLFQLDAVILRDFNVAPQIEEMFDVTFCYFPITFRPPPNDPYRISADDLKVALRGVLAATPAFAPVALPLFLEKFQTSSGQTMKDLLQTIAACFPVYGAEAVGERGEEFWDLIKTEILYSSDKSVEIAALGALESLMRTLYPTMDDKPVGLGQTIVTQCVEGLQDPGKNSFPGWAKCIAAMLRGSPSAGAFAISQTFPPLFKLFDQPKVAGHRAPILHAISSVLLAARSVYAVSGAIRRETDERSLEPYREALLDVLREGLQTIDLKIPAIKGSVALAEIPGFWSRLEVEKVVRGMDELLINDKDEEVRSAVLSGLRTIVGVHAEVVQSLTLPILFHALPDAGPAPDDSDLRETYRSVLRSLTELCTMPALFETLTIRITTKLDLLSSSEPSSTTFGPSKRECDVAYAWDLLHTLETVINKKIEEKHADIARHYNQVVPRLCSLAIKAAYADGDQETLFRDRRLLVVVGSITETLFWELSPEKQSPAFQAAYAAFEGGDLGAVMLNPKEAPVSKGSIIASGADAPRVEQQNLVAIYSALVRGLKSETPVAWPEPTSATHFWSRKLAWIYTTAVDDWQRGMMASLVAAFINKRRSEVDTLWLTQELSNVWREEVLGDKHGKRAAAILSYFTAVKALSLLRDELAYTMMEDPLAALALTDESEVVGLVAPAFGILAEGKKGRGAHLTAKLLWAQRLWNFLLPKLVAGEQGAEANTRRSYLTAFASLLPLVPSSLLLTDLPTILPLLLRALSLPSPAQRTNVITTLGSILETANSSTATDQLLHAQAESILEGVLHSIARREGEESSGKLRISALTTLGVFPSSIRYETLHGSKSRVIKDLAVALDDPLRAVRREAVDTRDKWYQYGK